MNVSNVLFHFLDMTTGQTTYDGRTTDGPTSANIAYLALKAGHQYKQRGMSGRCLTIMNC